jgi:imidazolonepropionase-like amidohydrolase
MTQTLFENAALLDATVPERREGHHVLVEGEVIREVSDRPIKAPGAAVFDLAGRTLMPGLIDAHVHAIAVTTDLAALARMPPALVTARALLVLEGMLARGFTTVRDAGGAEWGLAEAIRRGYHPGPRLFVSGLALAQTGGQGDFRAREELYLGCPVCRATRSIARVVDGVDDVRKAVRDELRKGADQIKVMAAGGMVSGIPIDRAHYSMDELRVMVEEAQTAGTYVMAHAYESAAVSRCVECGIRSIEHGNLIDAATARLMAARGTFLVPTMAVYEGYHKYGPQLGFTPKVIGMFAALMEDAITALEVAQAAGVRIGHGTDMEGILHHDQSREFPLKAQVMSPLEVITCATATNADLLRMTGKLGVIAPDAYADLLVVNGDPLEDLGLLEHQGGHMAAIMKAGAFYKNELGVA